MRRGINNALFSQGSILIEILIAMSISLLVMSVLFEIYSTSQRQYRVQRALLEIQANAAMASKLITSAIKKAGWIGCAHLSADFPVIHTTSQTINSNNKIAGTKQQLTIRYMDVDSPAPRKGVHETQATADCTHAELYESGSKPTTSFASSAETGRLAVVSFYTGMSAHNDEDGNNQSVLFLQDKERMEMVAGIQDITFHYYVRTNGHLQEIDPANFSDWSALASVSFDMVIYHPPIRKTWHVYVAL